MAINWASLELQVFLFSFVPSQFYFTTGIHLVTMARAINVTKVWNYLSSTVGLALCYLAANRLKETFAIVSACAAEGHGHALLIEHYPN